MLLFRGCGMGLALICALLTFIIGHVPTWLLGCRGHDRSPVCAKPDEIEAEVQVVVVEVKLSVVVTWAMVEAAWATCTTSGSGSLCSPVQSNGVQGIYASTQKPKAK